MCNKRAHRKISTIPFNYHKARFENIKWVNNRIDSVLNWVYRQFSRWQLVDFISKTCSYCYCCPGHHSYRLFLNKSMNLYTSLTPKWNLYGRNAHLCA